MREIYDEVTYESMILISIFFLAFSQAYVIHSMYAAEDVFSYRSEAGPIIIYAVYDFCPWRPDGRCS